jgi:hypothetical protein
MRKPGEISFAKAKPVHPHQWLWEALESDPSFVLRPMFGGRAAYLDGRLMLFFAAKTEPWCGVLLCTDRIHHASLQTDFAELTPHPILPKWLYLPETVDTFERTATRLVRLARQRDPRLGVTPQARKKSTTRKAPGRKAAKRR